jgi:mRNA-degrading endonuclease YafQ of YafQ-DinJ toxin-antitoxin module
MVKRIGEIHFTSVYLKSYQKLPKNIQKIQDKKEKLFKENSFHPSLKTHKLKGKYKKFYSYSVTRDYRVLFRLINGDEVFL